MNGRPQKADEPGWPRPKREARVRWDPDLKMLPAPYINGEPIERSVKLGRRGDGWLDFRDDCYQRHVVERRCVVCGEPLNKVILLGAFSTDHLDDRPLTSGPGGHPRCMWLAVKSCPHLQEKSEGVVAYRYRGKGIGFFKPPTKANDMGAGDRLLASAARHPLTLEQVREIALADPMGEGQQTSASTTRA